MNGNKKRALMLLTSACMTMSAMPVSALAFEIGRASCRERV